jgi:imidazolonepropionase-like amidohydrolase
VLPGAASVVRLDGFTREDACLKCPAAILIEWPDMKLDRSLEPKELEAKRKGRDEAIDRITHAFQDARSYQAARTAGKERGRISSMEAVLPVLEGKRPLMIRASSKQQIDRALRWVEEDLASPGSKVILLTSSDAVSVAGKLAALKIPVILDEVLRLPQRADEPYDVAFSAAAALVKAGVLVAIGGGTTDPASARNLPHQAATAVGHGLDRLVALQSITLNPAKIFGLDSVIGSLEPGKEASFVIWSGNPLDLRSRVEALYHRGQSIDLSDRQKRLWDRYKKRPKPSVASPAVAATPIAPVTPVAPAGP